MSRATHAGPSTARRVPGTLASSTHADRLRGVTLYLDRGTDATGLGENRTLHTRLASPGVAQA
ncbi:MAG: hypothetical protein ABL977_00275 [Candidatus Eisenbacteria bacterium]